MFNDAVVNTALDSIVTTYGNMTVALSTTQPYLSGGLITGYTEPVGGGYTREPLPTSLWNPAANRAKSTNAPIEFNAPTANWGLITNMVIIDESTGTPIFYGTLSQPVNITAGGDAPRIVAGGISIAFPA